MIKTKNLTLTFPPIRSGGSSSASRATLMVANGRLAICCISLSSCCTQRQEKKRSRGSTKVSDLSTHTTVKRPINFPWWQDGGGRQGVRKMRYNIKKFANLKPYAQLAAPPLVVEEAHINAVFLYQYISR